VIIEGPNGALAFAVERRGIRYLTLGFDPLPYLGRENLPMSVFTLNVLDWFLERRRTQPSDRRAYSSELHRFGRFSHDAGWGNGNSETRRQLFFGNLSSRCLSSAA
jgi:hypothetical protein